MAKKTAKEGTIQIIENSLNNTIDLFLRLRPLTKEEKTDLNFLSEYLSKDQISFIKTKIKQKKAKLVRKKKDFSFLISGKNIIPKIESQEKDLTILNQEIERKYLKEKFKEFKERAWNIIPQYIASNIVGLREVKQACMLQLFTEDSLNMLLFGNSGTGKTSILDSLSKISSKNLPKVIDAKKNIEDYSIHIIKSQIPSYTKLSDFNLAFIIRDASLEQFADIAEKIVMSEKQKPKQADMDFIREYINHANQIKVEIPNQFLDLIKDFSTTLKSKEHSLLYKVTPKTIESIISMIKASARIELRDKANHKDLERVFDIFKKTLEY